jgi:2-oxoglutarate dehydrogenase complex, dehydrogenase (E1) component, and related enzymes
MSSSKNNTTFKKTSFLSGINSEFINQLYSDFLSDPNSLPEGWKRFFEGLSDDEKLILNDINGPSWSPGKKIKKINFTQNKIPKIEDENNELNVNLNLQGLKDSVRAIMLIRAYRIRGHLIANLDPLFIQEKKEHSELNTEHMVFSKKILIENIFRWEFKDYTCRFKSNP